MTGGLGRRFYFGANLETPAQKKPEPR